MSNQQQEVVVKGLGFCIEYRPHGLRGHSKRAWVRDDAGRMRLASPEEEALWLELLAARARVVELEAQADAAEGEHETRRRKR
jgi:hypothetical protein